MVRYVLRENGPKMVRQVSHCHLQTPAGHRLWDAAYQQFLLFYKRVEPDRCQEAAADAARGKIEREHLQFPEFALWAVNRSRTMP